ncbi:site-specific integrase [Devosia sp. Root105]|uniref:tyrosine-type recombinase/integrase n=1 Tax=Devosia sp. Root105 TaxID=1736423 RepID=UPI000701AE3D|nr:site-specific integrase [Devosia sp. Root105]KQU94394.1 integrase [Devosia sp. Root105]
MKQAKVLTDAELKRVLAVIAQSRHAARNRALVLLSHYAGMRVGEIAALTWGDLLEPGGDIARQFLLKAAHTKTNEARSVHIGLKLSRELAGHRSRLKQEPKRSAPLIASQKGGAFSANSLCQLMGRIYASAGVSGATSHSGRRWFITQLAHSGVSPKVIMTLAGHRSLATTQRYIDVNDAMLARAVEVL